MTVGELKQLLEDFEDDQEVKIMSQPSWPFEYDIAGLISRDEIRPEDPNDEPDDEDDEDSRDIFILEGSQLGYGSKRAWDNI